MKKKAFYIMTIIFVIAVIISLGKVALDVLDNIAYDIMSDSYHKNSLYHKYNWADVGAVTLREEVDANVQQLTKSQFTKLSFPKETKLIFLDTFNNTSTMRLIYSDLSANILGKEELLLSGIEKLVDTKDDIYGFYKVMSGDSYLYENIKINKHTGAIEILDMPEAVRGMPLYDFFKKDDQVHALFMDKDLTTRLFIPDENKVYNLPQEFGLTIGTNYVIKNDVLYGMYSDGNMLLYNLATSNVSEKKLPENEKNAAVREFSYSIAKINNKVLYISHFGNIYLYHDDNNEFELVKKTETISNLEKQDEYLGITNPLSVGTGTIYLQFHLAKEKNTLNVYYLNNNLATNIYKNLNVNTVDLTMKENEALDVKENSIYFFEHFVNDDNVDEHYANLERRISRLIFSDTIEKEEVMSLNNFTNDEKISQTEVIEGLTSFVVL